MTFRHRRLLVAGVLAGALAITSAYAQQPAARQPPTPGFNNKIPEKILTPDAVQARIGTLRWRTMGQR